MSSKAQPRSIFDQLVGLITIALLSISFNVLAVTQLSQIRVSSDRLVAEFSAPARFKSFSLHKPERFVLDLIKTQNRVKQLPALTHTPLRHIRFGQSDDQLRLVLDLKSAKKLSVARIKATQQQPERLVISWQAIKTTSANKQSKQKATKSAPPVAHAMFKHLKRDVIVVIDPGHGGKDPGATSRAGVEEKRIVLSIARALKQLIDQEPGMRAVLTRSDDYYVSLRKRLNFARQHKGDIFLAIHADAYKTSSARGASVYALSQHGASSEAARWLAERENRSEYSHLGEVNLADTDRLLKSVLIDLAQTATISSSVQLGNDMLLSLGKVTKLQRSRVEQAGFVVLKSPDIPSILIETGFISNPVEAARLSNPSFQRSIAHSMFVGIKKYFSMRPPPGTWVTVNHQDSTHYVVTSGDNIRQIAASFNVSVQALQHYNKLPSQKLYAGLVLKIPPSVDRG